RGRTRAQRPPELPPPPPPPPPDEEPPDEAEPEAELSELLSEVMDLDRPENDVRPPEALLIPNQPAERTMEDSSTPARGAARSSVLRYSSATPKPAAYA